MTFHTCPVCGTRHEVNATRHYFAYGRQLVCSPHCKTVLPEWVSARILAEMAQTVQDRDNKKHEQNDDDVVWPS